MKAYIQTTPAGDFFNVNAFIAEEGFRNLGWETIKYVNAAEITDMDREAVVVGGIANVRKRLELLGFQRTTAEIDYPEELIPYLGRKVWSTTLEALFHGSESWDLFVKPKEETKKFTGKVMRSYKDFTGMIDPENPTKIWCSELVDFKTEWRCFIRYGEILDIRRYKGDWDTKPDLAVIRRAIADFKSAPAAYALDFGIDAHGEMKLVEVNDGHSLGTYGIGSISYAKFLSARWAELTNTKDYAHF